MAKISAFLSCVLILFLFHAKTPRRQDFFASWRLGVKFSYPQSATPKYLVKESGKLQLEIVDTNVFL